MEFYLAIKRNEIMTFAGKWKELQVIMWEMRQIFSLMCRPYSMGLCVSVRTDNKTRKGHGGDSVLVRGGNNCGIYVTGKQEVGVLERVKETSKWQT